VINVECPYGDPATCGGEWPAFRQNRFRDAQQIQNSDLANPYKVKTLEVKWKFDRTMPMGFRASPIVYKGKVYIGGSDGFLYCLNAANGAFIWQYPAAGSKALTSQFTCNPSSFGIASSAAIGRIREEKDVVIFGAPDRSIGAGLGSGRLFALDANTGTEVWKSPEIAVLNGTSVGSTNELHEQIGYSSPLVYGGAVYIGVANHCDNPIQNGKVVAVDLNTGAILKTFSYTSTSSRGGGVWTTAAGGFDGIYI
jgi:outer membrane protein assembly factor BamB